MLNCVAEKRTAPPNAWLWSLIAKCSTSEDIKLLFDILQKLRTFVSNYLSQCSTLGLITFILLVYIYIFYGLQRLSNLRIHDGFNSALCREVTKACVRAGAIDFGKNNMTSLIDLIWSIG